MGGLSDKNIVLGVTGGIAAYKAAELCRLLRKAGARVRVVMTEAACEFITPLTMQALSGQKVARELFDLTDESQIGHIQMAETADLVIVAPATANAIARFAAGMADDLLATVVLATKAPVLLAPSMNVNMWQNPRTQANLAGLLADPRITSCGPDSGDLACGWVGAGRLVDPTEILEAAERLLSSRDLAGRSVVVTAGPTWEVIDDVRFIGNRSSGKMGFAIARSAARRGATVTLIAGPVSLPTPAGIAQRVDVESALQMQRALRRAASRADVVVMAAAVADYRPVSRVPGKMSRRTAGGGETALALLANPDLLAGLGRGRRGRSPLLVGFAAEVGAGGDQLVERARRKLKEKRCDVVVANDVGVRGLGFDADNNAVTLVFADGRIEVLPPAPKTEIAEALWNWLLPIAPPSKTERAVRADGSRATRRRVRR